MSLTLYSHPLSSFCQKVLVALYESETPFEPRLVDFGDEASRAEDRPSFARAVREAEPYRGLFPE
jgi:glutathione S-transferase